MSWDEYDDYDLDGYDEIDAEDYLLSERADNDKYDIDNYDRYDDDYSADDNSDYYDNNNDDDDDYTIGTNHDDYTTYVVNGEPYYYDELVDLADEFDLSPDDFSSTEELIETLEEAQNMVEIGANLGIDVNDYDSFESFLNAVVEEEENSNEYVVNGISYDYDEITDLCRQFELEPTDFSSKEELIDLLEEAQKMIKIGANLGIDVKDYDSFESFLSAVVEEEENKKLTNKSVQTTQIEQNTTKTQSNQKVQKKTKKIEENATKDIYYNQDEYLLADAMRDAELKATKNATTFNDLANLGKKYDVYAENFSNNNEYLFSLNNVIHLYEYGNQLGIYRENFDDAKDYKQLLTELARKEYHELNGLYNSHYSVKKLLKKINELIKSTNDNYEVNKWRNNIKDGACYGLNPNDYLTETRYELALLKAIDKSAKPLVYDYKSHLVDDVFASDFTSTSQNILSKYEIQAKECLEFENKYPFQNDDYIKLCNFILSRSCIASRYITTKSVFLYATALQENFALPFTYPVQYGEVTTSLYSIIDELIEYDIDFAIDAFAWLLREFSPYLNYCDRWNLSNFTFVAVHLINTNSANVISYLSKHSDLLCLILNTPLLSSLRCSVIYYAFIENEPLLYNDIKLYLTNDLVSIEDKAQSIDKVITLFYELTFYDQQKAKDRIKPFLDEIYFPIILNSKEEIYDKYRENWAYTIDDVLSFNEEDQDDDFEEEYEEDDELDNENDENPTDNFTANTYPSGAWQNDVENGEMYGVFLEEYENKEEYLQALQKAKEKDKANSQDYVEQLKNEIIDEALNQYYKEYLKEYELEVKKQKDKLEKQDEKDNEENKPYKFTRRYVADTSTYPKASSSMKKPTYSTLFRRVSALHYLRNLTINSYKTDDEQNYDLALFIVNNPNAICVNYITSTYDVDIIRAISDHFDFPFKIDLKKDVYLSDIINELFSYSYEIATEVYCWIIKTFGKYGKYFDINYKLNDYLDKVVNTNDDVTKYFIDLIANDEDFISAFPNLLYDMKTVSYLLLYSFLYDKQDAVIKLFVSCFNSDNIDANTKNDAIMQIITSFTEQNYVTEIDYETNDKYFNIFLDQIFVPVVKQCQNPRIRNYFRKFDKMIDEYYAMLEYNLSEEE